MEMYDELLAPNLVETPKNIKDLATPPGFGGQTSGKTGRAQTATVDEAQVSELKAKKAWEIAVAPAKSLPMTLIMNYMTGNSLQIIPMTMAFMLLLNPIKAIVGETNRSFHNLSTKDNTAVILQAKVIFVICQLLNMGVGVYKLYKMGLIPNSESDWIAWKSVVQFKEAITAI